MLKKVYHNRVRMSLKTPWVHGTYNGVDLLTIPSYLRTKYSDCTFENIDRGNDLEKMLKITGPHESLASYLDEWQDENSICYARIQYENANFIRSDFSDIEQAD